MDDASLQVFCDLNDKEWAAFLPTLTPQLREVYNRMAEVEIDLNMGAAPPGVIVCHPRCHGRKI